MESDITKTDVRPSFRKKIKLIQQKISSVVIVNPDFLSGTLPKWNQTTKKWTYKSMNIFQGKS